jgi:hypothetical protein
MKTNIEEANKEVVKEVKLPYQISEEGVEKLNGLVLELPTKFGLQFMQVFREHLIKV